MIDTPMKLDADLLVLLDDDGHPVYELLEEDTYESRLNRGEVDFDDDGSPVLVVDPKLGVRLVVDPDETAEWRRKYATAGRWDVSSHYRWRWGPGPWLDEEDEDGRPIPVGSRL